MLAVQASCTNEYAKDAKEKNMTFSTKCLGALLKYKRYYLLNNMQIKNTLGIKKSARPIRSSGLSG